MTALEPSLDCDLHHALPDIDSYEADAMSSVNSSRDQQLQRFATIRECLFLLVRRQFTLMA